MSNALIHLVDDDAIYGATLLKILEHNKYKKVVLLDSGEACLEHLNKKPALIILDFSLEGLNGLDVLRQIKEKNSKSKVVILTSLNNDKQLINACKAAGALGFFQKNETGVKSLIEWMNNNVSSGLFSLFG